MKRTLGTAIVMIVMAAPALLASTAEASTIPETSVNLLIGTGLIAGACFVRWRKRAH